MPVWKAPTHSQVHAKRAGFQDDETLFTDVGGSIERIKSHTTNIAETKIEPAVFHVVNEPAFEQISLYKP